LRSKWEDFFSAISSSCQLISVFTHGFKPIYLLIAKDAKMQRKVCFTFLVKIKVVLTTYQTFEERKFQISLCPCVKAHFIDVESFFSEIPVFENEKPTPGEYQIILHLLPLTFFGPGRAKPTLGNEFSVMDAKEEREKPFDQSAGREADIFREEWPWPGLDN